MVRKFLDIEPVNENGRLADPANKNTTGYSMMVYENAVAKFRNGDCKTLFYIGRCDKPNCSWTHDQNNVMPASQKGKGKGKKGKGKGRPR